MPEDGLVSVEGARIAYRVDGPPDAPALVFSNSIGMDLSMWEPQAQLFAGRFRVIRYDSRGHGRSDAPPGPYTLERLSRDVLALLDALAVRRTSICGLSLGGLVAQWLAVSAPERLERLIIANTAARIGTAASWEERIVSVRAGGMRAIRDAGVARYFSEPFRAQHPAVAQRIGAVLEACPPEGYIGCCAALRDADLRGEIARIHLPTLIIAGAHDVATTPAQAQELHAAIAGSQLAVLDAAHLSNLEQPHAFNARLLAFLTAAPSP